jgi:glycosyltransferase involved in cell wall biosynthesis
MKVLIVNYADLVGGAARAAYRLHESLRSIGVRSQLLVASRTSADPDVAGPRSALGRYVAKARAVADQWPTRLYPDRTATLFTPASLPFSGLAARINASDADVVHLHWINGGMARIEDIAAIRKPIVWSLHDMWAFTGGCHYDGECGRYTLQCGACPVLGSEDPNDLSRKVFERKARTFAATRNMTIVGLSGWMAGAAKASTLFKDKHVVQLPNPIDTSVFTPTEKREAKRSIGLNTDRPLVLFGAMNATADPRKGFKQLSEALRLLPPGSVELGVFGANRPADPPELGHPTHYLGHFNDDRALCTLYNAADVTLVPSIQENLSNTIVESLACGTPAVGFAIGGNSDMIVDRVNGALARPFDATHLAECIRWVVEHPEKELLRSNARRVAMERFDAPLVARRYEALYASVIAAP